MFGGEAALVQRTGGNRNAKRLAVNDSAEISAGSQSPSAAVKIASEFCEMFRVIHGAAIIIGTVSTEKVRGRGAASNPANRFEKTSYHRSEWDEPEDPSPHTLFLRDETRTIINYNDSP